MRAVSVTDHGGPEVLRVEEIERPEPDGGELLVEIGAAGVNPVDTYFRDGTYEPVELPFTPGVDFAGTVESTGEGVEGFETGDRVYGTGIGNGEHQGAYAEYATVPTDRVVELPEDAGMTQAGAAGVVSCTAWRALVDHAALDPAEYCLVHGGSGGVGHVAVQIASAVHARCLSTAAPTYHDDVEALGAEAVLDYGRDDLAEAVLDASDGGVDVILDHRLDDYLQFDADVAAADATVVGIGENDPAPAFSNVAGGRAKDVTYQLMSMFNAPDLRVPLRGVAHLMDAGVLGIETARSYGLDAADDAQRDVMDDSFLGKLVIEP
ncbi:alcohol dehydrogenase catalytic domain-containing protein [Natronomonas sp. LN261]|uniref:alcohol dehydrogenase catalytic domain-containing protein n=1 Tax=Natronomonas sp. LN261 TaxID=2750669 RepID=UPI0015EEFB22|nr:zinc-binding dehydrogenase [Natronomonas sp. LN261]